MVGRACSSLQATGAQEQVSITPGGRRAGDGLCEEIAPAVFTLLDDGLSYVKEGDKIFNEPGGHAGLALVPEDMEDATRESAEECPGECIFIEE